MENLNSFDTVDISSPDANTCEKDKLKRHELYSNTNIEVCVCDSGDYCNVAGAMAKMDIVAMATSVLLAAFTLHSSFPARVRM